MNGSIIARRSFILTVACFLIAMVIFNGNTSIGIDAFAKKSKTSSSGRANGGGSSGTRDKGSSTIGDSDKQVDEPNIPESLPLKTPTNGKYVIINFDDSHESDYTYAKPTLDKYGFKATFFEVCNWIEEGQHDKDISITWQQIAALQQDGMDIESHTMTHPNLNGLSKSDLDYEIGQSKQCLEDHGFNPTIFAYPNGEGSDNPKVVNTVAKYYDLARTNTKSSALTFLHCDGNNDGQTDCSISFSDGTLTPSNRYSINSWTHKHIEEGCSDNSSDNSDASRCKSVRHEYDSSQMFEKFITAVNSQNNYNNGGIVRTIPIIVYHTLVNYPDLSDSNRPIDTTLNLFDAEMKYLYYNGFKVITMSDLVYDENTKSLYIKGT
jgi:peptidoglycan/xylan/chitin deacetylase (PgdA/CDA1 family)